MDGSSQQPKCLGCLEGGKRWVELEAKLDRSLTKVEKLERELAKCKDELAKVKTLGPLPQWG